MTAIVLALLLATPAADDPWADVSTWASYWHVSQPTRIEPAKPVPLAFSDLSAIRETATAMADDLAAEVAVHLVLADRGQQRVVVSAMLCEARQRAVDTESALANGLTRPLARAAIRAAQDVASAQKRLLALDVVPMACGHRDVERIINCLGLMPSQACVDDDELAAQLAAAARLAGTR